MKIEKINENQIRCTLTSSDLESRKIRLSELAYGSDKAKLLFHDMMQQARNNFGFDSGNSPLMIEAIPISPDSIVLIITKVDDPEELDTRFSKFSPGPEPSAETGRHYSGADEVLDLFRKFAEAKESSGESGSGQKKNAPAASGRQDKKQERTESGVDITAAVNLIQAYRFGQLEDIIRASHSTSTVFDGVNTLIKDPASGDYCLLLHADGTSPEAFNKVCNILTEYASSMVMTPASEAHLLEHGDVLIRDRALQTLEAL